VKVVDADRSTAIPQAKAILFSETGEELATGITNSDGVTCLRKARGGSRPKFVMVEREHYFLGGLSWLPGAREYFIKLVSLSLR